MGGGLHAEEVSGWDALGLASRVGVVGWLEKLGDAGSDVNAKSLRSGDTALMHAARTGQTSTLAWLLERGRQGEVCRGHRGFGGGDACGGGDQRGVHASGFATGVLLSRGPATSAPVGMWLPALPVLGMMAAPDLWGFDWEKLSKQLMDAGVDGKAAKLQGKMSKKDVELFKALEREGNPNATRWRNILNKAEAERALLVVATSKSNVGACKALLEAGADVKVKSHSGWGLIAECLIKEYWAGDGKSKKEIYETADLLVDHGAPTSDEYFHESLARHPSGLNYFKNRITKRAASFAGVSAKGADAELLLMKAVQDVNSDLALAKGARLDSEVFETLAKKQGEGWTALRWAASNANAAMVSTLLSAGADPNECRAGFDSPLEICMKKAKGSSEARHAASILCRGGADPEASHGGSPSAARQARAFGYTNWAEEMIEGYEGFKSKEKKKLAP